MLSGIIARFREMGLPFQAILMFAFSFTLFDLTMYFSGNLSAFAAAQEAFTAAIVFTGAYYITSRLMLLKKNRKPGKGRSGR